MTDIEELTTAKHLTLKVAVGVQNGQTLCSGFARADYVSDWAEIDYFDPDEKAGYQRSLSQARVRKARDYYRTHQRMPNHLLVNIRREHFDEADLRIYDEDGYRKAVDEEGFWTGLGELTVPRGIPLWIFDGQHRLGSLGRLIEEDPDLFAEFPVPLSITLGLTDTEEMKEFFDVNSNAKAVKTDLAWELLRRMAEEDPALAEELEVAEQDWTVKGAKVADALVEISPIWRDSIQQANESKRRGDRKTLNKAQFIRSLRPVLYMPAMAKADPEDIARVLDAYWQGIATLYPEAFGPEANPKDYVLQKGPGVIAFHRVLPQVIEVLRARGDRLADPNAYAEVLKDLPNLQDEVYDDDGTPVTVRGTDYWLAGPKGVASQFTGDAGRKRLAMRIQALLPKPSQELNL